MKNEAFYALVQGRFYKGDIEGKRYHWTKGIPGSIQLSNDISCGKKVSFIYYRTWDSETRKGKYFYGAGVFDNKRFRSVVSDKQRIEYFADISNYQIFSVPVTPEQSLRAQIWTGANRQPGIKRVSEEVFNQIYEAGLRPGHINSLTSVLGERDVEGLLNNQIVPLDIKDSEGHKAARRAVRTEVYKRSQKIIRRLKKRYKGLCQITGEMLCSSRNYGVDVTEAHHIDYLSEGGMDGDPANIIIISPEWHRLIHKENPKFDREGLNFVFKNGKSLSIKEPGHLKKMVK